MVQQAKGDDKAVNLAQSADAIRRAAAQGAQLVLLQELHAGRYFCQQENAANFDQAEALDGPTSKALASLARELGIVIVGSIFERRASGLYHNTAIVLESDGTLCGHYRKMHIPDDPGYYEKFYFAPGDQGFKPIDTSIGVLGLLVCWDQWYPEAARLMALQGADLLLYPTAIGWDRGDTAAERARQCDSWLTIQRAHAIANGLPLLCANRCGHEADPSGVTEGIEFWGQSFIAGPQGEILAQAGKDETELLVTLDMQRTEKVRRAWPFLRDRRIDAYQGLLERYAK